MTRYAILRRKLLIPVGIKEPRSAGPNQSGTYRTHLFRRVVKRHCIELSIGNLLEVVYVRADPYTFVELERGGCMEMNALASLYGLSICVYWRVIVCRVP